MKEVIKEMKGMAQKLCKELPSKIPVLKGASLTKTEDPETTGKKEKEGAKQKSGTIPKFIFPFTFFPFLEL